MRKTTLFLLLALGFTALSAQYADWVNYTPGISSYGTAVDGAYLWVATNGGLVKMHRNSLSMEYINHANSGLPSNRVYRVAVAPDGVKWLFSSGGPLIRYDGSSCQTFQPAFAYNSFNSIAIAGVNDIWLGTETGGLVHFDGTNFIQMNGWTDDPTPRVASLALDNLNRVWFSNLDGLSLIGELVCWDGTNWIHLNHPVFPGAYSTSSAIAFDVNNHLWIGTFDEGLFFYDGVNWTNYTAANSGLQGNIIYSLALHPNGGVWLSTNAGVNHFFDGVWTLYSTANTPMLSNSVTSIRFDDQNVAWFTGPAGLNRLQLDVLQVIDTANSGLPDHAIYDQIQTADGAQWFASFDGLFHFAEGIWTRLDIPGSHHQIRALDQDSQGNIWLATRYDGVIKYDGNTFTPYTSQNSPLPSNMIQSLAVDSQDRVWIATASNGLFRLDGDTWSTWTTANSALPTNDLTMVEIDELDNVWVNAYDSVDEYHGLIRISGDNWTIYPYYDDLPDYGLPSPWVRDVKLHNGEFWIATASGVARLDGGQWTYYDTNNCAIPDDNVTRLSFDQYGSLWISTLSEGIARFANGEWTTYNTANSGLANDQGMYLYIDNQDNKWVGHYYDGASMFSGGGVSVSDEHVPTAEMGVRAWPNPFSSRLSFSLPESKGVVKIGLYNLRGQLQHEWSMPAEGEVSLDLDEFFPAGLPSGIWLWKVRAGDQEYRLKTLKY